MNSNMLNIIIHTILGMCTAVIHKKNRGNLHFFKNFSLMNPPELINTSKITFHISPKMSILFFLGTFISEYMNTFQNTFSYLTYVNAFRDSRGFELNGSSKEQCHAAIEFFPNLSL